MADSSISVPMAQELTKPDVGNLRRNSTGKILSSNSVEKVPHYLRASTGSCHDFCKYGRKDAFEEKERCPIRVAPRRLSTISFDSHNSADSVVLPERKNISVIKLNHSHESKTFLPDTGTITKQAKQQLPKRSADRKDGVGSELLTERKKLSLVKFKTSSDSKPSLSCVPKTVKQEVSSSPEKLKVSAKKGWTKLKEKDLSTKHVTSSKPKSLATKELSSTDTSGGSKGIRNSNSKESQRTVTSLKPNSLAANQISSLDSSGGLNGLRKSEVKMGKKAGTSLVTLKKVLVPPTGSLSPKPSLRRVASLKAQNRNVKVTPLKNQNKIGKVIAKQLDNDMTPEKTLYVIKIETENKPLESDQDKNCEGPSPPSSSPSSPKSVSLPNSMPLSPHDGDKNCEGPSPPSSSPSSPKSVSLPNSMPLSPHDGEDQESEYTMTETEEDSFSEDGEVDSEENAETLNEDYKGRPRKSGIVCSEDVDSHPLKFRRGKVVDMQFENNRPRRLKFRRGKVLGENENIKSDNQRRRYKKREGVDGDAIGTDAGAEKVVLRHQDVQGKKDEKGLFNNVIEETASKLVETQKSKVKALVGAFETVISLQERKPSANSVS
ncbi:PREDICTED: uncharacterized protein DDB_G0284459-like isoform X1 [Fragaria vesca subsp. vesca]|uniref:uncharacterized protein DDB_G0284459-like isoform X1 n=1 Tax=Fragaria vesca subsp. vesca TaxID=101020 RepID=UPI0002C31835|nr:PREDICTED: uncharacterized protein DDB_G0284459-like isoform X1 [Fragaria vesca subsp. vesca]XP_004304257.1 PREDICTED: uncharacterized protein DDB_G0284459-like isoform X1 [Fragaria vesca subsp. vesca]